MTMKLKDFARLKGEVLIQSINEFGEISTLVEDKNLIVSYGRNNICNGLVGNPSSYVYDVVFGNGGTIPGNVNVALSVSPGEVAVKSPISASNGKDYIFTKVAETSPSPRAIFSIILPKLGGPLCGCYNKAGGRIKENGKIPGGGRLFYEA